MECDNIDQTIKNFNEILFDNEAQVETDNDELFYGIFGRPQPKPPRIEVNFENFVRENCKSKISLLERSTFHRIKRPILIFFNHFREKCAYHAKWLHRMCQLSLKYGDSIEFIAGDMLDINIMHIQWQSLDYFDKLISPERETPIIFAIDENKRTYQYSNSNKSLEKLMELCENLLNGKLYHSEPLPENNATNLVKICVSDNYEDLVLKSSKHILLVVGVVRNNPYETNYENVAQTLKDYNLEVVYLKADRNYVPFELNVTRYPSLLYFPADNKNEHPVNFGYRCRKEEYVVAWLKQLLKKYDTQTKDLKILNRHEDILLPNNINDLENYLATNFKDSIQLFNREYFEYYQLSCQNIVLIFVHTEFINSSPLAKYLQKIYQLKQFFKFEVDILVADFKDFDVITLNCECENYSQVLPTNTNKIYAIDRQQRIYEYSITKNLDTLYYFLSDLTKDQLYYSQLRPEKSKDHTSLVATCVADNLKLYISNCKRHICLFIYKPNYKDSGKILAALEHIARNFKKLNVKVIKINAQVNYIPLEYSCDKYPVSYFIPRYPAKNKIQRCLSKCPKELIEFVTINVKKYKEQINY